MSKFRNFFRFLRRRPSSPPKGENKTAGGEPEPEPEREAEKPEIKIDPEIIPPLLEKDQRPTYFHVGGCAKECLLQGFKLGVWQLVCTAITKNGYHLSTFGEAYPDAWDVIGGVEVFKEIGNFSLSQTWLRTHVFLSELGLHFGSGYGILTSAIGTKDEVTFKGKLKCGFELSPIKVELVVPIYREPLFMGYFLAEPVDNCLLGYRAVYNFEEKGFDMHALCLGYYNGRTELGLKLENFKNLRGSFFQRIGERWAMALKANLYSYENVKQLSVGGQYDFRNGKLIKIRLREDSRIGFVYQAEVNEHLDVMYHLGFDLLDPIGGAHKIGVAMEFHC